MAWDANGNWMGTADQMSGFKDTSFNFMQGTPAPANAPLDYTAAFAAYPEAQAGFSSIPAATGGTGGSWFDGFLGSTNSNGAKTQGWGTAALGLAQGFGNMYMGMKQYGLAKDALKTSKEQFARNYEAQRTITNAGLEDRQRARVASNPGAYQSVGAYMNQNKVA